VTKTITEINSEITTTDRRTTTTDNNNDNINNTVIKKTEDVKYVIDIITQQRIVSLIKKEQNIEIFTQLFSIKNKKEEEAITKQEDHIKDTTQNTTIISTIDSKQILDDHTTTKTLEEINKIIELMENLMFKRETTTTQEINSNMIGWDDKMEETEMEIDNIMDKEIIIDKNIIEAEVMEESITQGDDTNYTSKKLSISEEDGREVDSKKEKGEEGDKDVKDRKEQGNLKIKYNNNINKNKNKKERKTTNNNKNEKTQLNRNYNTGIKNSIKLGSINIRGLNELKKQSDIRRIIENEQWNIAIISETRLIKTTGKFIYKGWQNYEVVNSSYNEENRKNGIMIILKKNLSDRKFNIEYIDGHVIKMDLLFKKQKSIKLVAIYNPSNEKETTNKINRKLIEWMRQATILDQEIIIAGDFNESDKSISKKKPLKNTIQDHGLYDIHKCLAGKEVLDTWTNGTSSSRINYIFSSRDILEEMINHEVIDVENLGLDHKALTLKFKIKEKIKYNKSKHLKEIKNRQKRIILETEDWNNIAEIVEENLLELTEDQLERTIIWDKMTEFYNIAYKETIKEKRNKERQKINTLVSYDIDKTKGADQKEIEPILILQKMINEYEKLEKLDNINTRMINFIKKIIEEKWKKKKKKTRK
jgi:hypothetical protein